MNFNHFCVGASCVVVAACGGRVAGDDLADIDPATGVDGGRSVDASTTPSPTASDSSAPFDGSRLSDGPSDIPIQDADDGAPQLVDGAGTADAGCPDQWHAVEAGSCLPDDPAAALPSTAPCLTGGNVLFVQGDPDSAIYQGTALWKDAHWQGWLRTFSAPNDVAVLQIDRPDAATDPTWNLFFGNDRLPATFQLGKVYSTTSTRYYPPIGPPPTVMDIGFGYTGCPAAMPGREDPGAMRFDEIVGDGDGGIASMTVAFWVTCDGYRGLLRGCARYAR